MHNRGGMAPIASEFVATSASSPSFSDAPPRPDIIPSAVSAYTLAPLVHRLDCLRESAVTIARSMTSTFAGVRPADVAACLGALAGALQGPSC